MTTPSPSTQSVVIVGCGGFARNYLPVYRGLPQLRVLACIDANLESARQMADTLGAEQASSLLEDAITTSADYAVVSTPNHLHKEHASALLRSGKHVLLQKPMARDLAEARELVSLQRSLPGLQLGLYMSMLDFGLWWKIRDSLRDTQPFGEVVQVSMRLGHTGGLLWNRQPAELWRFSREKTGGGAFIMLGVHYLHFLRWLLGVRIIRVLAQTANLHCKRVEGEDICQLQGELDNGGMVQLSTAWNSQGEHFSVYGTEGSLVYLDNELLRVHGTRPWRTSHFDYTATGKWQTFAGIVPPPLDDSANPYNQHLAFASALRQGVNPAVTSQDGLWDHQVTDAVYRSAQSGKWVSISYE